LRLKDALKKSNAARISGGKEHSSRLLNSRAFCGRQQRPIGIGLPGGLKRFFASKMDMQARCLSFTLKLNYADRHPVADPVQ
jgi:hypothetical protein